MERTSRIASIDSQCVLLFFCRLGPPRHLPGPTTGWGPVSRSGPLRGHGGEGLGADGPAAVPETLPKPAVQLLDGFAPLEVRGFVSANAPTPCCEHIVQGQTIYVDPRASQVSRHTAPTSLAVTWRLVRPCEPEAMPGAPAREGAPTKDVAGDSKQAIERLAGELAALAGSVVSMHASLAHSHMVRLAWALMSGRHGTSQMRLTPDQSTGSPAQVLTNTVLHSTHRPRKTRVAAVHTGWIVSATAVRIAASSSIADCPVQRFRVCPSDECRRVSTQDVDLRLHALDAGDRSRCAISRLPGFAGGAPIRKGLRPLLRQIALPVDCPGWVCPVPQHSAATVRSSRSGSSATLAPKSGVNRLRVPGMCAIRSAVTRRVRTTPQPVVRRMGSTMTAGVGYSASGPSRRSAVAKDRPDPMFQ